MYNKLGRPKKFLSFIEIIPHGGCLPKFGMNKKPSTFLDRGFLYIQKVQILDNPPSLRTGIASNQLF